MLIALQVVVLQAPSDEVAHAWLQAPYELQRDAAFAPRKGLARAVSTQNGPPREEVVLVAAATGADGEMVDSIRTTWRFEDSLQADVFLYGTTFTAQLPESLGVVTGRADDGSLWMVHAEQVSGMPQAQQAHQAFLAPPTRREGRRALRRLRLDDGPSDG